MKNKLISLSLTLIIALSLCLPAQAASQKVLALKIGSNRMVQGSQTYKVDSGNDAVVPIIQNGRTLVPVSQIVKMFGGTSEWDGKEQLATFSLDRHRVLVSIDFKKCMVDGKLIEMDTAPQIINGRTYAPLRAVLEGLGLHVAYESSNQVIVVSDGALSSSGLLNLSEVKALLLSSGGSGQTTTQPSGKQIAPAVTLNSIAKRYDTSSRSSVYIPDLSAATGGVVSTKEAPGSDDPNAATYSNYPRDPEEAAQAAQEYYNLLASLPYLKVLEPLNEKWGFYRCSFQYTGTGTVKKNTLESLSGDTCDLYFYMEKGGRDLHLWFAQGFQIVDTGHRLSLGQGSSSAQKTGGARLTDAYNLSNGVYSNASDGKLAAKSGQCSLLINGSRYTGTAQFHTENAKDAWATDKFTISGFKRADWIELAFPMNYAQSGDVYTAENFQRYREYPYSTTNMGAHWAFAVSANNGSDFVMPMANSSNVFDYSTVRVLQWDKSADTVVYFAAKLVLNGQSYDVEGLLAAPNTVTSQQSSGGVDSGDGDCWYCGGSGTCPTCGGSGRVSNWMPGTAHTFLEQNCTDCYSPGVCRICGGRS